MPNFQHHNDHSFEMHEHKLLELSKPENFLWHPFMLKKKVTEYFNSRPKLYISASDPSNCQKLWTKLISSQLNSRLQRYSNLTFFFISLTGLEIINRADIVRGMKKSLFEIIAFSVVEIFCNSKPFSLVVNL